MALSDSLLPVLFLQLSSFPAAPIDDGSLLTDQSSAVPSVASVSVGEVVGNAMPLRPSSRRIKFLIEWRDKTIPITLDDSETIGIVMVLIFASLYMYMYIMKKLNLAHHIDCSLKMHVDLNVRHNYLVQLGYLDPEGHLNSKTSVNDFLENSHFAKSQSRKNQSEHSDSLPCHIIIKVLIKV